VSKLCVESETLLHEGIATTGFTVVVVFSVVVDMEDGGIDVVEIVVDIEVCVDGDTFNVKTAHTATIIIAIKIMIILLFIIHTF
jgi:hypothetical protein